MINEAMKTQDTSGIPLVRPVLTDRELNHYDELSLGEKQELFCKLLPVLMCYIFSRGYRIRQGDGFRDPRAFGKFGEPGPYGKSTSVHKWKLAKDLFLMLGKKYLTKTEDYRDPGEYWETLHPLCRWGGRFKDGNHFSIEHEGYM